MILLCCYINLVVFCPWLCAINSVDPISSSVFYGPMLWLTAAGWIVSVGDVGLNAHHFWSKNPWFLLCFSINLVVFCPWLCAINSVGPISSLDFYGPMLWLTAAGWIVSVGGVGPNAHHFWSKNPWFLLCFSINLVVLCPWLCAINSVDPISSLDFYGPMLWLTAAGWIVSVGDVGLNAHHFWSNNPWFLLCFSINLVVLCPWLCAINSVDPISSSDFYGPMLWLTAAGWIVSVGDVGLNAHHFWSKNPWFLLCFSFNLVVFCPWLCAINSVDPISSSVFYGPILWLTAAGWIVSVGDVGLNAHLFWSKKTWFYCVVTLIWWFFALGFVPSIQWTRSLLQFFMGPCYDSQLLVG